MEVWISQCWHSQIFLLAGTASKSFAYIESSGVTTNHHRNFVFHKENFLTSRKIAVLIRISHHPFRKMTSKDSFVYEISSSANFQAFFDPPERNGLGIGKLLRF